MPSPYAAKLANVAILQHARFQLLDEHDKPLCDQIEIYWKQTVGGFTSCTTVPWSAVFVSWCVKDAGATRQEFKFAASHSVFVNDAINSPRAYRGRDIAAYGPAIGDIIQQNRNNAVHDFAYATANANYTSHSAIVVEVGQDSLGLYALTIGGNESDSIRRKRVALDAKGLVRQKNPNPYICVLECLK